MQLLLNAAPAEISRQNTPAVAGPLQERFKRLQALDNTAQDSDPRDGFVSLQRADGTFQAILGRNGDGMEYNARVMKGETLVRGENATVSDDGTQVLASHYEAGGQKATYCGPGYFQDITTESEAKTFFIRRGGENSFDMASPAVKQWSTQGREGFGNVSVLAEFLPDAAGTEDYYYLHNFDLMWNP